MANLATINNNLLADSGIDPISVVTGAGTATQIAYWSSGSAITGENALVWDATNDRMGVGVVTPAASIHIEGAGSTYSVPSVSNVPGIYIQNTNSASGTANTFLSLRTTGASGGDPILSWDIGGVIGWSAGIDNSDGDKFKIANYWAGLDSNTRLTIDGSGNVGIGTTAPNTLLEANRTIVFSNIDTYGQFVIKTTSGANGKLLNFGVDEANTLSFIQSLYRGIDVMNLVLQRYGGNVGIGVNPSYKLDVNGNVRIGSGTSSLALKITGDDNYIEFDNSGTYIKGGGNLTVSATSNLLLFTGASERMRITSGGSVGIGTSSPLTKLHVSGSISAEYSDSIYLDYSPSAGSYKKGFSGLNQSSGTARGLHIFNYDNDSNQGINFWVGTNASKLQAAVIKNNRQVLFNAYGSGSFTGTVAYNLAVDASGNIIETAGGVVDGSGTANYVPLWSDPNTLTNSIIYQTGGNVGIGTTSPTVKLDIEDLTTWAGLDLNGGSGGEIRLQKNGTTYGQIYASDGASTGFVINAQQSGNSMQFQTAGIERMRLTSGGSFGIGTSSPTDIFSVQGNTNLGNSYGNTNSSTYTTRISGYAMRYDASNRYGNYGLLILNSDNGWTASARRFMLTNGLNTNKFAIIRSVDALTDPSFGDGGVISSGTADFVINNTGNIGIGTTSPAYKLQVEGNAAFATNSGGLRIDSYDGNTAVMLPTVANGSVLISDDSGLLTRGTEFLNGGGVIIQSLSGFAPLDVKSNGSNLLYVTSSGSVGVGTTSPSYKLDVIGNIASNAGTNEAQVFVKNSTSSIYLFNSYAGNTFGIYDGTAGQHRMYYDRGSNFWAFFTGASERMRITSDGNIGVGTSSPNGSSVERTIVLASNTATYYITNAANTLRGIFALGNATTEVFIGTQTNHEFHFRTNDTRRMTLKTTGQLQLNAYTSASSFTGTAAGVLAFDSSGNVITQSSTLYPTGSGTTNYVTKWTGSNAIGNGLLYDNGTNVGLGTTAPTTRLMIESSGASFTAPSINDVASLYIRNSNNGSTTAHSIITLRTLESGGGNPFISFDIENIRGYAMGIDNADDDKFKLNYGWNSLSSNTLMTVTYGGNVGIGTTSPATLLHLQQSSGPTIRLVRTSNRFDITGDNDFMELNARDASTYMIFKTADTERMRLTSGGYLGIGTSAPTRTLDVRSDVGVLIKGASSSTDATLSLVPASGGRQYDFRNYGSSFGIKDASADVIRMYFHYNGNTGIGTSNPINTGTTIETTGAAFSTTATKNSNMYGLTLVSTTNENTMSGVWFGSGGGVHWSGIAGSRSNYTVDWSTHLSFYTHIGNTVNINDATEKMRITGDGNVGIGTTSPSSILHINSTNPIIKVETPWSSGNYGQIRLGYVAGTNRSITGHYDDGMTFDVNGERMRINPSGYIFINSTSVTTPALLNIKATAADGNQIYIVQSNDDRGWRFRAKTDGHFYLQSSYIGVDTDRFMIRYDNGNVGIGTTSPSQKLEVAGIIRGEAVNVYGSSDPASTSPYLYSPSTGALGIGANGSERMRITSGGNVGIGISNPVSKLEVSSTLNSSAFTGITVSNWAGGGAEQSRAGIAFKAYDWVQSAIWHGRNTTANTNGALVFGTNPNTTDLTVAGVVGRMWIINNGNVGIGSENPSHKLQILGSADSGIRLTDSSGNTRALLNPSGVQHGEFSLYNNNGNTSTYLGGGTSGSNYVVAQGGNFGVGTTAPLAKLSIGSGSLSDSNVPAQMSTGGAGTGAYFGWNKNGSYGFLAGMSNGLDGWTAGVIRMITTDPLYFITNNNGIAMSINSSQQVSIGTTVADTKLSVNGDMNIKAISGGTSYKLYFGSEVTSGPGKCIFLENFYLKIQGHRNEGVRLQGVNASGVVQEFATFYGDSSGTGSSATIYPSGGSVSIGKGAPVSALDVNGRISLGGALYTNVAQTESGAGTLGSGYNFNLNNGSPVHQATGSMAGVWYNTGSIQWYTNSSQAANTAASERMRITSGGNVAIGNSTAVSTSLVGALTIWKTYGADGASVPSPTAQNYYNNQDGLYLFGRNSGLSIISANGEEGMIHFANASTIAYATLGTTSGTSSVGGDMYFKVGSNNERMRITSSGNIGIATSSPSVLLHLENSNSSYTSPANNNLPSIYVNNTNSSSSTAHAILALRTLGASGGDPFISFDINGIIGWSMGIDNSDSDKFKIANAWSALDSSTRFSMETGGNATFTGTLTANSFFESSDLRLKTLIEKEIDYSAIANIEARYYKKGDREELGYFAQDFESILPSSISKNDEGFLNLSYNQVHTAKIAALEAKIKQLESQLKNK